MLVFGNLYQTMKLQRNAYLRYENTSQLRVAGSEGGALKGSILTEIDKVVRTNYSDRNRLKNQMKREKLSLPFCPK